MQIVSDLDACPELPGSAVTIGAYDGVHLGHRAVISAVRSQAASHGLATTVVTFDRHPASVVRPESAPKLLTDLPQRLELLEEAGVDVALVVPFDEQRALEPPDAFVREVLAGCARARLVVVGFDFHFGHRRQGNPALLEEMGSELGFEVAVVEMVGMDGEPAHGGPRVSSTAIREALALGDLASANEMLGRAHEVRGTVERGDGRGGAELGFPTANVEVPGDICMPANGIYAGWYVTPGGTAHASAISLGRRPTFYEQAQSSLLEAHLLDFEGSLYGQPARVQFVRRLRDELKFDSVDALVAQIELDCEEARKVLLR